MRLKMRRCANMMMNKAMATGWRLWREAVEDAREERAAREALVGKAVRKMLNRQTARAFDRWKEAYLTWRDYVMPKLKLGPSWRRSELGSFPPAKLKEEAHDQD
jgi:hypothetical protein